MEALELLELVQKGESSLVQFKEIINNINQLAQEFCALANTEGGIVLIGVSDNGEIKGLSAEQIHKLNQWISNAASQNIKPPISPLTEIVTVGDLNVLVVKIPMGYSKPYFTNEGVAYVKMGADKRTAPPEEILRLFQSAGKIYADEGLVLGSTINDIDEVSFKTLIINKFRNKFGNIAIDELLKRPVDQLLMIIDKNISLNQLLQNMKLSEGSTLTLAGLLLIGTNPQKYKPLFSIKCISFVGNEISGGQFRDKNDLLEGNLSVLYAKALEFAIRNLKHIQVEDGFNSLGQLEIPKEVLEEIIVNTLVHRDYYLSSSIHIFIFDDRIEIISPGKLPNTLNENNVKFYTSIARNPIIYSNCAFAGLPFTGIGSGIPRAIYLYPNINLINDKTNEKFTVIIQRPKQKIREELAAD
jgi:ATP-dependent DNA helicase RecG